MIKTIWLHYAAFVVGSGIAAGFLGKRELIFNSAYYAGVFAICLTIAVWGR